MSVSCERRAHNRLCVRAAAILAPNDWSRVEIEILDVSERGFAAECEAALKPCKYVNLQVPGFGNMDARIIWAKNGRVGAQFLQKVDLRYCGWLNETHTPLTDSAPDLVELAQKLSAHPSVSRSRAEP